MHKLVNVLRVSELAPGEAVERELALIKVAAPPERRARADGARATSSASASPTSGRDAIVFEIVGAPEEVDAFEELVRPHGIKEVVRTGRVGARPRARPRRSPRTQLVLH